MGGTIRCAKRGCDKVMTRRECLCGNSTCYITVYYRQKHWKYRHDKQGDILTFGKAVKLLNVIREQIDNKTFDPEARTDGRVNERRFINKWEIYIEEKGQKVARGELSPSYVRILKSYRRKHFGSLDHYDVRDINLEHLAKVRRGIEGKLKTARNVINALSAFFHWCATEDGSLEKLPKMPVINGDDATPQIAIDLKTQTEALSRIPTEYRDPIEFGMESGCRPGEVAALKVKDIQGDKAFICRTYSDYILRETTKQKKKEYIPLSDRALEICHRNSVGKHPEAFLFTNPNSGRGYKPKRFGEIWHQYSGVDVKLYEATRHSFCTQLVEDGVPLPIIKELARHSDIRTTQKYVHPTDESSRDAVNRRGHGRLYIMDSRTRAERGSEDKK
jgi:integrase